MYARMVLFFGGAFAALGLINAFADDGRPRGNAVVCASPRETAEMVAVWNRWVDCAERGEWETVNAHLAPGGGWFVRAENSAEDRQAQRFARTFFKAIDGSALTIRVYRAPDGTKLGVLYANLQAQVATEEQVGFSDSFRWALIEQPAVGEPQIRLMGDEVAFGLDLPVEGVRLTVSPSRQTVAGWDDVVVNATLETVDADGPLRVKQPLCVWGTTLFLGLLRCDPEENAEAFRVWRARLEAASAPPISGLFELLHEVACERDLQFLTPDRPLGWPLRFPKAWPDQRGSVEGPTGTYHLFLVSDQYPNWRLVGTDPVPWTHRVVSQPFSVTVTGRER